MHDIIEIEEYILQKCPKQCGIFSQDISTGSSVLQIHICFIRSYLRRMFRNAPCQLCIDDIFYLYVNMEQF